MAAHGRSWPRSRHVAFRGPSKAWKASRSSTKHRADADVTSAVALSLLSLPSRSSEPRLDGRSTLLVFQPPITGPPTPRARNSLPQASAESLRPHQRELPEILRGAACHARLRTLRRWLHGFARQRTASRLNVKLEFIEYGLSVQTASRRPPTRGPASTLTEFHPSTPILRLFTLTSALILNASNVVILMSSFVGPSQPNQAWFSRHVQHLQQAWRAFLVNIDGTGEHDVKCRSSFSLRDDLFT